MLNKLRILGVCAAIAVAAQPAIADTDEDAAPGVAYASSYGPVPVGFAVTVRPWDNTNDNLRVKASFTDALSRRGIRLTEAGSPLTLNFETEIESLAMPTYGRSLGQVQGRNWDSRVRMNLWSNSQDSVVGGRRGADSAFATTRYILRATLDDQRTGQRLWQGEASYTGASNDQAGTFAAMAPVLVDGFGETLRPRTFRIQ
jgi:hypothetical protein